MFWLGGLPGVPPFDRHSFIYSFNLVLSSAIPSMLKNFGGKTYSAADPGFVTCGGGPDTSVFVPNKISLQLGHTPSWHFNVNPTGAFKLVKVWLMVFKMSHEPKATARPKTAADMRFLASSICGGLMAPAID